MTLAAQRISKAFERGDETFRAVQELSLRLEPGTVTEICGASGSGKSTLLNMLSGLLEPTDGHVLLDDVDLYQLDDASLSQLRNERFGIVSQMPSVLASMNVLENVLLPYTLYGKKDAENRAHDLLDTLGMAHLATAMPTQLSGGEVRRVAIARALLAKPHVVFADEPTSNLDDANTRIVLDALQRAAEQGAAVLLVTHDPTAHGYAHARYTMQDGVLSPA